MQPGMSSVRTREGNNEANGVDVACSVADPFLSLCSLIV
jgi:hypothetical protein